MARLIQKSDVTFALGYTPYDAANPKGYLVPTDLAAMQAAVISAAQSAASAAASALAVAGVGSLFVNPVFSGATMTSSAPKHVLTAPNADLAIGSPTQVNTSTLSFRSSGVVGNGYDAQIAGTAGSAGNGLGTLSFAASVVVVPTADVMLGAVGYLESMIGATEIDTRFQSLSRTGNSAGVFATRTSDDGTVYGGGAFAAAGFALNDNTTRAKEAWGLYMEARRVSDGVTGHTFGFEAAVSNQGTSNHADPFTLPLGSTSAMRASVRDDMPGSQNATFVLGVIGGTTRKFNSGLIFFNDPIAADPVFGYPVILDMTWRQSHIWRSPADGKVVGYIRSDVTNASTVAGTGGGFVFYNNGIILQTPGNGNALQVTDVGVYTNGILSVRGANWVSQGIGAWGHAPPAVQPTRAVTLADCINALSGCGITA